MAKYAVTFEVETEGGMVDALELARDSVLADRPLTVAPVVDAPARMRWSVTVKGMDGKEVMIVFDGDEMTGRVIVAEPMSRGEYQQVSARIGGEQMAGLVRGIANFPLDLMDQMALRDAARRKRGGRE